MRRSSRRCRSESGSGALSSWPPCAGAPGTTRAAPRCPARGAGGTVHLMHASDDHEAGLKVVGVAEATLSMQRVAFVTHVESGTPGEVVAGVIKRIRCDALFAGAHMSHVEGRPSEVVVSHAEEILRHTDIPVVIQP